jgi:glycosyltransferase involved in cell wall biosynthesis
MTLDLSRFNIVVIIPAYRVERELGAVLAAIPPFVRHIVVVNDASPDGTAQVATDASRSDNRVLLVSHEKNQGVGGAMRSGYKKALELNAQVVIKVDGDGQMDPADISSLIIPLVEGKADFTKGNRFRDFHSLPRMPLIRRIGNVGLSFLAKAATGYWKCFDPTNGFLAMRGEVLARLPLEEIHSTYFFEISQLSQLYHLGAVICDVPLPARYSSEISSLSIRRVLLEFPPLLLAVFIRRIVLHYFLYDFSLGSIYILAGLPLLLFGLIFGSVEWVSYASRSIPAPTGTVMLATLPVILGIQLLLSAAGIDLQSVPREPLSRPLS